VISRGRLTGAQASHGRRQPSRTAAKRTPDGLRVLRLGVAVAGLYRGITLTTVIAGGAGFTSRSMVVAVAAVTAWGCVLVWDGWRRGGFRPGLATLDVVFACAVELLSPGWGRPGMRFGYDALQDAAIVAGCALRVRLLAVALSALVSAESLVKLVPHASGAITVTEFVTYIGTLVMLALGAACASRLLRLAAGAVDRRHADRAPAAREQAEQRRVLHDTALATLTAIARGELDARADEVRARCARDAACLRLIVQGGRLSLASLPVALAAAAEEAAGIGLRVHPMCGALPPDLDISVVTALALAVREAFNNVRLHARTGDAWLTAAQEDGRVVVRVVDRGAGFAGAGAGKGISDSILGRMRDVGGDASVESAPGQGTTVELRWPA
jgi:signal transduction histidine kinase